MKLTIFMVVVLVTLTACRLKMPDGQVWVLERNFGTWVWMPEYRKPWFAPVHTCPFVKWQKFTYKCDASGGKL